MEIPFLSPKGLRNCSFHALFPCLHEHVVNTP